MNLRDYILANNLADAPPADIADRYLRETLALAALDEQLQALEPAVRAMASTVSSSLRKAKRGGPVQPADGSHATHGGPAQITDGSQGAHGGPAQPSHDSHHTNGGPAVPAWAEANRTLIDWCRDHQADPFWIPGAGRRKLAEITAAEWERRARNYFNQAEGTRKTAQQASDLARLINSAGADTIGGVLEQLS